MAEEAHHELRSERPSAMRKWLEIGLIFAIFFVHGGAPAPHVNETYYLAKAKHYWEPSWCQGDLFLESADAHLTFYWTIGWLAKFFSLPTVAWIGRIAAWGLLAWSWQRLSTRLTRLPLASVLSAALMVWLVGVMNFAGEWVVGGVEGKCFAYACVFAGLTAMVDARWRLAWPWFGLAGAFHVLVGGWSAIAAGLVWLLERSDARPSIVTMLPSLLLAIALALPGIVPALKLTSDVSSEVSREANQVYVFDRLPHHLAPLAVESKTLFMHTRNFSLPLLAFVILWWAAGVSSRGTLEGKSANVVSLSPGPSLQGRGIGMALTRICRFAAWGFLISVLGLIWEIVCWNHPALAASLLKYYWFRLADVAVPVAAVFLICYWIERLARERSRLLVPAVMIAVALPIYHLVGTSAARWRDTTPPADAKMIDPAAWLETCQWVRERTPVDAMFLVPRAAQSFTWNTGRKNVVTWKDVPQDAATLITWRDRYFDVYWHNDEFGEYVPYGSLAWQGTAQVRELAAKYGVDYVITREFPPLGLPVAYGNASYTVYRVSREAEDTLE